MNTFKRLLATLALVTMLAAPGIATMQDTPTAEGEPTADVVTATPDPLVTPVPPIDVTPPVVLQPGEIAVNLASILLGLVVAFIGGMGAFTLLGGLTNVRNDKATLDAIEKLANSLPVEALDKFLEIGKVMQRLGEIIETVTDRQPNVVTPAVREAIMSEVARQSGAQSGFPPHVTNPPQHNG